MVQQIKTNSDYLRQSYNLPYFIVISLQLKHYQFIKIYQQLLYQLSFICWKQMGNSSMACCQTPNAGENKIQVILPVRQQYNAESGVKHTNKNHIEPPKIIEPVRKSLQQHNPYTHKLSSQASFHQYGKDIFQGLLGQHGQPEGFGQMYYPNGSIFIGQFKKGIAEGDGHFVWPDGSYYHGKMVNNHANDSNGIYESHTIKYNGGIKDNHFEGFGVQQGDGFKFQGFFQKGQPRKGKFQWVQKQMQKLPASSSQVKNDSKWVYEGQFDENGNFSGKGKLISTKGNYQGQFLNGMKHGKGVFTYENKLRYEGDYENDIRNGEGTIYNGQNKVAYSGQFKNGMPHGKGWVPLPDGSPNFLQFNEGISSIIVDEKIGNPAQGN